MMYRVAVMTQSAHYRKAAVRAFSGMPALVDFLAAGEAPRPGAQAVVVPAAGLDGGVLAAVSAIADEQAALLNLLADAVSAREDVPLGASARVADHITRFAAALNLAPEDAYRLERAALLRGVGKLCINNHVLLKNSVFTYDDWLLIRSHPVLGAQLLRERGIGLDLLDVIEHHNECYDGTGYPHGLEGGAIPRLARALHLVDVYCAMTSPRHYRKGHATREEGLAHLRSEHGKHFDPHLVDVFLDAGIGREYKHGDAGPVEKI